MTLKIVVLVLVLACWTGLPAHAESLTGARVTDLPFQGLTWDTFSSGFVTLFVKQGSSFLNPADELINVDVTTPGVYDFDLRLNKGTGREMDSYTFALFFDGTLENATPDISVVGTRDDDGTTPATAFLGDTTYTGANNLVTLTALLISSFNGVDEVAEFAATPDTNIDYVGSFQLTVTSLDTPPPPPNGAVPEPSTLVLLAAGLVGARATARRRAR